jgi:hypothetical protein
MTRENYICSCRLDKKDYYFIWFSNESDGVYLDSEGSLVVFDDLESLAAYAERQKLLIEDEKPVSYNLEKLEADLSNKRFEVDCVGFLEAWNLFDDVSRSLEADFDSDHEITNNIYDKLFWGNNLPSMTPEEKSYQPVWSKKEIEIMRAVLLHGIEIFRSNLKYIN